MADPNNPCGLCISQGSTSGTFLLWGGQPSQTKGYTVYLGVQGIGDAPPVNVTVNPQVATLTFAPTISTNPVQGQGPLIVTLTAPVALGLPAAGGNTGFLNGGGWPFQMTGNGITIPAGASSCLAPGGFCPTITEYPVSGSPVTKTVYLAGFGAPTVYYLPITDDLLTQGPPENGSNLGTSGGSACNCTGGGPINFTSGNVWIQERDYSLPGLGGGLELVRTWNSHWQDVSPPAVVGMFGHGWSSTYSERFSFPGMNAISYWRADGSVWTFSYNNVSQTWSVASPPNEHASISYSAITGNYTMLLADGTKRVFNSSGYLTAIVDRNQNTTTISYDGSNRITSVTDAAQRAISFTYGDPNNTSQATAAQDATGIFGQYAYDSSGRLTTVTYADGSTLNFHYNDPNSSTVISSVTDAASKVLETNSYDTHHNGLSSSRANVGGSVNVDSVSVSYPIFGATQVTDSEGNPTTYSFQNISGRNFISYIAGTGCSTCGGRGDQNLTYDPFGNLSSLVDAAGNTTNYSYDAFGNVLTKWVTLTNNDGSSTYTWTYTYNQFGEVLTATDPMSNTTTNQYDGSGNLTSTTTPPPDGSHSGSTTTFAYDSKGELTDVWDPLQNHTTISYDPASGLIASIQDAQGNITSFTYDARGNRKSSTDAAGTTQFTYDVMSRLKTITQPGNLATTFNYDNRGRRTSVTDADNKTTYYAYDDADRLSSVTDAGGNFTQYGYDTEDNLQTITDAANHATNFAYDALGRVTQVTFPAGQNVTETYGYDPVGNLTSKRDRNGHTITYSYDNLYRLSSKVYPDSTSVEYSYDPLDRLLQAVDPTGTYGFAYDNMGRLTATTVQYGFLSRALTTSYTYDAASNRLSMTDPESGVTSYAYDTLNRLTTLTPPSAISGGFAFGYDVLSRRRQLTRPNGVNTNYSYDPLSRLTSVLHQFSSTTLDGATYTYDAVGNRSSKTANGFTTSFTYDPIYELSTALPSGPGGEHENYGYDAVGNRLTSQSGSYTYDVSNHMLTSPGATYIYDANGNTHLKTTAPPASATTTYGWDFENRLTSVTLPGSGGTVTFQYDPFGRRIQKVAGGVTTIYAYDGDSIVEELNANGTATARYAQGLGIDEPLARNASGSTYFYEADGLGSVTSITDVSGAIADSNIYESFGAPYYTTGTVPNPFKFTARELDTETGVYYYRARYYDQTTGRFLSEDPIGFGGGQPNFYAYVWNHPIDFTDPIGLRRLTDCEKQKLAPFIPKIDLEKADLHDGVVPWYFSMSLFKDYEGITRGNDIYFRPGVYDPSTINGLAVLGHELVHVGQYRNGGLTWFKYLLAARHGYDKNPYEIPAVNKEEEIKSAMTKEKCSGCPKQ